MEKAKQFQPSCEHFGIPEYMSYSTPSAQYWQRLYYSELWIRTVYTYRSLRARQLRGLLTVGQQAQLERLMEIVYEVHPSEQENVPRVFRCSARVRVSVPSFTSIDLGVQLLELCVLGAKISGAPADIERRQITLSYQLEIFDEGLLSFSARAISLEGGKLQLAFVGAPCRTQLG